MERNLAVLVGALIIGIIVGSAFGYVIKPSQPQATSTAAPQTVTTTYTKTVEAKYDVKLAYSEKYGLYLVDSEGRTLYFFAKDYNGSSSCSGACAEKWPLFYEENPKIAPGLNPDDFGVITRPDGKKQLTYKGWPLYYYADNKPGDINGDGVKGVWFVAKPDYTVMIAVKPGLGAYLVDDKGRTLYFFAKDINMTSTCYGECAEKWPPFTPNHLTVPSTLNLTDFAFIMRDDGTVQLTYKGQPLYYWINDNMRGDTDGHGVKGVWFVASLQGLQHQG